MRDFASRQQLDTQVSTVNRLTGVVAADQASIEEANINLSCTVLKSPLDGRVGLRRVDPSNLIQANSTGPGIISVVQEQPISVIFSMPETDLPTVRAAMAKASLPVLADMPDNSRVLATGQWSTIGNTVDSSSGTIQFRADFPNTDRALPDADDPRLGARRRVHVDAVDRAGGRGDLPVPAQRVGDDDAGVRLIRSWTGGGDEVAEIDGVEVAVVGDEADDGDEVLARLGRCRGWCPARS